MHHIMAVGGMVAIRGTDDGTGVERQYMIRSHEQSVHAGPCDRTEAHLHLVGVTDLRPGYVEWTPVHFGDTLIIDGVPHTWFAPGGRQFILIPAS